MSDQKHNQTEIDARVRCYYYQKGSCTKPNCTFVHDMLVKSRPPSCSNWENGNCRYENSCKFFHGCGEDQDVRDMSPEDQKNKKNSASKGASAMNWRRGN